MVRPVLIVGLLSLGCASEPGTSGMAQGPPSPSASYATPPTGATITARFPPPAGYARQRLNEGSFGSYLRALPLKPEGAPVRLYNGTLKAYQGAHTAVIDMSVGAKDLQQCADAVMRLRAEYLFAAGRNEEIAFTFTNGFNAPFSRWAKGERIRVKGNVCSWVAGGAPGATHEDLLEYLEVVFTYAGTASLSRELKDRSSSPVQPGDIFIQGGHPGHAVIVMDVAADGQGEQVFLLAQSYMPAQEIHVLKNPRDASRSPWYRLNDGDALETPEWTFRWDQRKGWP